MTDPKMPVLIEALKAKLLYARSLLDEKPLPTASAYTTPLRHILEGTVDLGQGLVACSTQPLLASQATLARAILERLFQAAWVTVSEGHAAAFEVAGSREMARQLRLSLERGHGVVRDKRTGEERTAFVRGKLEERKLKPPVSFEVMAREGGLSAVHGSLYGVLALMAHGNTVGLYRDPDEGGFAMVSMGAACLEQVSKIVADRLLRNVATPASQIISELY
jgi:hypothetical protein